MNWWHDKQRNCIFFEYATKKPCTLVVEYLDGKRVGTELPIGRRAVKLPDKRIIKNIWMYPSSTALFATKTHKGWRGTLVSAYLKIQGVLVVLVVLYRVLKQKLLNTKGSKALKASSETSPKILLTRELKQTRTRQ